MNICQQAGDCYQILLWTNKHRPLFNIMTRRKKCIMRPALLLINCALRPWPINFAFSATFSVFQRELWSRSAGLKSWSRMSWVPETLQGVLQGSHHRGPGCPKSPRPYREYYRAQTIIMIILKYYLLISLSFSCEHKVEFSRGSMMRETVTD